MTYCGSGSYFKTVLVPVPASVPAPVAAPAPVPVPDPDLFSTGLLITKKFYQILPFRC